MGVPHRHHDRCVTQKIPIAAGICLAGMQLIEAHRGRSLSPAKKGSDVLIADEVAEFLGLDRYDVTVIVVVSRTR